MLKSTLIAPLALAIAMTASAAPATARTATGATTTVIHSDLNLASEAGRKALDLRLERAARQVCGGTPDFRAMRAFNACVDFARTGYEAQKLALIEAASEKRVAVNTEKLGDIAAR